MLAGLVASGGCQSVDEPDTASQIGAPAATTTTASYPSLYSVPPRPQLSYTVQQQRAIVDGLIADRANALYTDQVVRYRTGRSTLPPPPPPPAVVAAVEPEAPAGATTSAAQDPAVPASENLADSAHAPIYRGAAGDDTLGDFVDQLVRETAPPSASGAGDEGASSGGSGWFGWLRNLFGSDDEPAPPSGAASPAAGPPAAAPATPVEASAPAKAEAALAFLVAETRPTVQHDRAQEPVPALQPAMAPGRDDRRPPVANEPVGPALAASERGAPTQPIGIAIGNGEVAIEVDQPAPAAGIGAHAPAASRPAVRTAALSSATGGAAAGSIAFAPGSAELPAGIGPQLEQMLASARTEGALIRIIGEAKAPALALDRARAVAIALVRLGARAGDLQITLASNATGDQAHLLLAPPAAR